MSLLRQSLKLTMLTVKGGDFMPLPSAELLLNAEVLLSKGEELRLAKVIQKHKDSNVKSTGDYNKIPMLNTVVYDVQFPDGA